VNGGTVSGEVTWGQVNPVQGATVRVLVEDVSFADASSTVVASHVTPGVDIDGRGGSLPFSLPVPDVDPRHDYSVRAHVDANGDGEIGVGDLISMQSHPVLTQGHSLQVVVPVRPVT
jgi:uncharacterized lipoprotein YbaY